MPDRIITAQDVADTMQRRALGQRLAEENASVEALTEKIDVLDAEAKKLRKQVRDLKAEVKELSTENAKLQEALDEALNEALAGDESDADAQPQGDGSSE